MQDYTNEKYSEYLKKNYNYQLEYCEDGTVMGLYFEDLEWKTSTNNKKNAKESFYLSNKSFDELFWECFPDKKILESLDKNIIYKFILIHPENRLVICHTQKKLLLIEPENCQHFEKVQKITPILLNPPSLEFLETYLQKDKRGILIKIFDNQILINILKYDFNYYKFIASIRGNNRNIKSRYLQLLKNPNKLHILMMEYPEYYQIYFEINQQLENLYEYFTILYYSFYMTKSVKTRLDPLIMYILKTIRKYSLSSFFCLDIVKNVIHNVKNPSYNINKLFLLTHNNNNVNNYS